MRADDDSLVDLDEVASMLDAHEGPSQAVPRPASPSGDEARRRSRRPRLLRLGWGFAGAAVALLVGSGLGFGLADSVTPSGAAGTPFAGSGFLPARGWTVVQSGTIGSTGTATSIAANVPLRPGDTVGAVPRRTLEALPARGVVVYASFTTRGDPAEDFKFAPHRLPLRAAHATPVPGTDPVLAAGGVSEYRLAAAVGGHNVDVRIYYGRTPPSSRMVTSAQQQVARLVVAAEQVTIFARPTVVGLGRMTTTLFGSVANGRGGQLVDIQAKDCGQRFFRGVAGTQTRDGGQWTTEYLPGITTSLRAVWNGHASAPVAIRSEATVSLRRARGAYEVGINAKMQFWHRRVLIQQRRQGSWRTVRSVLLTKQGATTGWAYVYTSGSFRMSIPRGAQIRAVLPANQARPCYLASISNTLRVG